VNDDELEVMAEGLQRIVGSEVVGLGFVPDCSTFMLVLAHGVTAYLRVEDGALRIEIDAPTIQ
jgi:hypothetical protein